jgi:hypothetical protein
MAETITSAIEFLKLIKIEEEAYVRFIKKDGTPRLMKCTLDFNKIPKDKKPKGIDLPKILTKIQKSKILSVYDLEKQDWRSVPFDRLEYLQTPSNKKVYMLKKIK